MAAGEAADQQRRAVTTCRLAFQFAADRCEQRHRPAAHRTSSAGEVKRGLPGVREVNLSGEGVAYLKVDSKGFDEQNVIKLLAGEI